MGRNVTRPRKCKVCHGDATWAWEYVRQATVIKRDGQVLRGSFPEKIYYCDECVDDPVE